MLRIAVIATIVVSSVAVAGCWFDAPRDRCTFVAPWHAIWTSPGLFAAINESAPGYELSEPELGIPVAPEADRFAWGIYNFTVVRAALLVTPDPGRPYETVGASWDGSVSAVLKASGDASDVADKLRIVNDALFDVPDAEFDSVVDDFLESRTTSETTDGPIAHYRAAFPREPAYSDLLVATQDHDTVRSSRGLMTPYHVEYQLGPSWNVRFDSAVKSFGDENGTVEVGAADRTSSNHTYATQPDGDTVRSRIGPIMQSAGVTDFEILDLDYDGTTYCG